MTHFYSNNLNFDSFEFDDDSYNVPKKSLEASFHPTNQSLEEDKEKCVFCPKLKNFKETFQMLNKALYLKYSSSQNYYYTKEINEIVENEKKPHVIHFKSRMAFEEEEETLTRLYKISEFDCKLNYLTEYYKYHKEVPRIFMIPVCHIMNNYHDKKRRIEYFKIKRILNEQNKGIVTNNNQSNRESTERKYVPSSEETEQNPEEIAIKINENHSKILALLDISSKNEFQPRNEDINLKKQQEFFENNRYDDYFRKKNEGDPPQSFTLDELNFYLSKVEENPKNIENDSMFIKKLLPEENLSEIVFKYSEEARIRNNEDNEIQENKNNNKRIPQLNFNTDCGVEIMNTEPKMVKTKSNLLEFNKNELVKSCKNANNLNSDSCKMIKNINNFVNDSSQPTSEKPKNNLRKALKFIEQSNIFLSNNNNYNNNINSNNSNNKKPMNNNSLNNNISNDAKKNMIPQFVTLKDLSKKMQIFNKLITQQKNQLPSEKNLLNTKSHRVFNSIDFLNSNNSQTKYKTMKITPTNLTTTSLSQFQNFLTSTKEKLNEFIQSKQNLKPGRTLKNFSSNTIQKLIPKTNHRRIFSSENTKTQYNSSKNPIIKENDNDNKVKNNIFQSATQIKTPKNKLFHEPRIYSPKPMISTLSDSSPSKLVTKSFKPTSPTVLSSASLFLQKKPLMINLRKLNFDEKVFLKKNRQKPKSLQLNLKLGEKEFNNQYKVQDQGNSKNTSINSKTSGQLTSNSKKMKEKSQDKSQNTLKKGYSSSSLKTHKREGSENTKTQQMKINIISNFFNFNNGAGDKDTKPLYLKLKNEFSNLKSLPNYKFLDINLVSKVNEKEIMHKKSKIKMKK